MTGKILPIVEGQSEEAGVPVLLRRLLHSLGFYEVEVALPWRVSRTRMLRSGEIERAIALGMRERGEVTAVLVILDADDDDADTLEASLLERCRKAVPLPTGVVAARRELEAWFLGSKDSLRGVRSIRATANAPDRPEEIRGTKERLSRNMEGGRVYNAVHDQAAFAARMDLDLARQRCASFRRLVSEVERIRVAT